MKYGKAKEILTIFVKEHTYNSLEDLQDALMLSIQCVNFVQNVKDFPHLIDNLPLPEETEIGEPSTRQNLFNLDKA